MAIDSEGRAKVKRIVAKYKAEKQELMDALEQSIAENDELRPAAEKVKDLETKHAELQGKVKAGEFRKAFDAAAKEAGIKPEMLDDAWELSKLDTKGEPDPKAIARGLGEFVEKRPHFKADRVDDDQGEGEAEGKARGEASAKGQGDRLPKGEGAARGGAGKGPAGKFVVERRNLSDMGWMQQNQGAYTAAVKANNVHYVGPEA